MNGRAMKAAMLCGSCSMRAIAYSLSSMSHPTAVLATLKPILNKVVDEFDGKIHFVEIDIEQDRDIAENAGVTERLQFSFLRTKICCSNPKASSQRVSTARLKAICNQVDRE